MSSYAVQVHLYGSVAVVTLCAKAGHADGAACLERLAHLLARLGVEVGSLVLDLDRAPYPTPSGALDAVDAWAAGRQVTVVALAPSNFHAGAHQPGTPLLRPAPVGPVRGATLVAPPSDEAAPAQQLRHVLGTRVLLYQAAGIRQARHRSHPCS